jgi:hypothetical protein
VFLHAPPGRRQERIAISPEVLAYLDPGSGSMLLQALLGGIAGIVVTLRLFGRRVTSFLAFWRRTPRSPAEPESEPD